MADSNSELNANANQVMADESSDGNEQNSAVISQINANRTPTPVQRATATQTNADARINETHHITSQRGLPSTRSTGTQHRFRLGHTQPFLLDDTFSSNQDGQENAYVTHPSDEMWPPNISDIFSRSIEIYHPPPRESIGVEDTRPHDMPTPIIFNINRHELVINEGNNRLDVDVNGRAHDNPGTSTDATIPNVPANQVIVENNTMTTAPTERPHDTDFSVDTHDPHSDNQSDADSEEDEHRLATENAQLNGHDNDLTHTNEDQPSVNSGIVSVNNENATELNQTNITVNQPITTNSSCPEALDNERNVSNPIGGVRQLAVHATSLNLIGPKIETHIDSGDESSGESTA